MSFYKNGHEQSPEWSLRIEKKVRIEEEEAEMKKIFRLMVFRKRLESIDKIMGVCPLPAHKQIHTQITDQKIVRGMDRLIKKQ